MLDPKLVHIKNNNNNEMKNEKHNRKPFDVFNLTFDLVTMFEANLTIAKFPLPIVFSSS